MAKETNRKQSTFERLTSGKLNRGQRKDLKQRLQSDTPRLEVIQADAAGIDIGNESHFAAVAPEKDPHPVREFGSWTGALSELAEWLQSCDVKTVATLSFPTECNGMQPLRKLLKSGAGDGNRTRNQQLGRL